MAIAAAVNHTVAVLRASDGVPAGIVRYDPRVVQSRRLPPDAGGIVSTVYDLTFERSAASAAELRTLMRAEAGSLDSARVCASESLRTCTLREAVAVVATSDPVAAGDSAQVIVKAMWLGNLARQPVQDGVFLVTLRQRDGRWEAVTSRTLVIS
ncbi:hypothetical protein [Longimicrobium terrae]|uniref:Uncharacterized protein n=1 Tax=Longimicrobium terrae TaxID=1639882 RepID=A0A841GK91_9BACT|nr:hypothetical protein [Longimicrobium terrae]MBB4634103.1 hypothetical protein [Longimicrobium terrae]MBB6069007.1 hypothetical protein [Longimicrobium terrae]NNC28185.1 hypothetical protein [Longimicrobium terrae]